MLTCVSSSVYTIFGEELELDDLHDIVNHGMECGVSGFIYSSELDDKFTKNEDEIMNYLDRFCDDCFGQSACSYIAEQLSFDDKSWTMQEFKEYAVWMYVELRAHDIINDVEDN